MDGNTQPENELRDEFRNLRRNILDAFHSVLNSAERKRVADDIENGLVELMNSFRSEADSFQNSPTGQQLKTDMEELGERLRSGEVEREARQELTEILRKLNEELTKATEKWRGST